jgi:hypothetical protein
MNITKNPVFLAVLATCVVFAVTYYYYNYYCKPTKKKDVNGKKKKECAEINETIIVSSVIAGLITWYTSATYFTDAKTSTNTSVIGGGSEGLPNHSLNKEKNILESGTTDINKMIGSGNMTHPKVPRLDSEDLSRSYNLIGSGVNIPRADLKIPSVLIDYK